MREAFLRAVAQIVVEAFLVRRRKRRQLRYAEFERQIAALGDLDAVGERLRNIGEQFGHFGLRPEILVGAEMARAALVREHVAFGDAYARLVRAKVVGLEKLHRVRRHHRQFQFGGELQRLLHAILGLLRRARLQTLQFQVVTLRKKPAPTPARQHSPVCNCRR